MFFIPSCRSGFSFSNFSSVQRTSFNIIVQLCSWLQDVLLGAGRGGLQMFSPLPAPSQCFQVWTSYPSPPNLCHHSSLIFVSPSVNSFLFSGVGRLTFTYQIFYYRFVHVHGLLSFLSETRAFKRLDNSFSLSCYVIFSLEFWVF